MNKLHKFIAAGLVGMLFLVGSVTAQVQQPGQQDAQATAADQQAQIVDTGSAVGPDIHLMCPPFDVMDFASNTVSYLPKRRIFVVVDSIDCAVDILQRSKVKGDTTLKRIARYTTDVYKRRHDLVNIVRPVSVEIVGERIVFLASSAKDSSYLGVLDFDGNLKTIVGFNCTAYAFHINLQDNEIIVMSRNPVGYDVRFVDLDNEKGSLEDHLDRLDTAGVTAFHYHVPKQSERIQAADPVGIGLTVCAVAVVFLALMFIALILKGYGKAIMKIQDRKARKDAAAVASQKGSTMTVPASPDTAGEVYAAIATAIYLYNEEMHDEENTIITIQKVERAWTPWNAKFYNMNHYFNRK
ncbi:MAG: OadG family protein [Bacteroidales bacterium]|nr:OadG family protein [Bacteroidales bacterium]